jgi:hypothetical protein
MGLQGVTFQGVTLTGPRPGCIKPALTSKEPVMYLYRKRHKKTDRRRCVRKNAKIKAKNRRRIARVTRGER